MTADDLELLKRECPELAKYFDGTAIILFRQYGKSQLSEDFKAIAARMVELAKERDRFEMVLNTVAGVALSFNPDPKQTHANCLIAVDYLRKIAEHALARHKEAEHG